MKKEHYRQLLLGGVSCAAMFGIMATPVLAAAQAQEIAAAGTVSGQVRSAEGNALQGVRVSVAGTSITTFTARDGSYTLRNVPSGSQTIVFSFVGSADNQQEAVVAAGEVANVDATLTVGSTDDDTIVVTGTRTLGINQERAAVNKLSVLETAKAADLPDINVAEAIQRLPGVYIDEDRGEGRFVSIRGADSTFNRVTINGIALGSPESNGLGVPLDVFAAGSVSRIRVTKSAIPSTDANSVGGAIDLRTPSAIGRDDEAVVQVRGGFHDLGDGERLRALGGINRTFGDQGQFGLSLNANYSVRDLLAETVEASDYDLEDNVPGFIDQLIYVPDDLELRNQETERERFAVGGTFEWAPTDTAKFFAMANYARFTEEEYRNRLIIQLEDGFDDFGANGIVVSPGAPNGDLEVIGGDFFAFDVLTAATFLETENREIDFQRDLTEQTFETYGLGGEWEAGGWRWNGLLGYSSVVEDRDRQSLDFRVEETDAGDDILFDLNFDNTNSTLEPVITNVGSGDVNDPANFRFDDFDIFRDDRIDEVTTLALDAQRDFTVNGNLLTVDAGFRGTFRDREIREFDTDYDDPVAGANSLRLSDPRFLRANVSSDFLDGAYDFGPGVSRSGLALLANDPLALLTDEDGELFIEYTAEEDVLAGYIQGTYQVGNWTILGGLRVEETEFTINSTETLEVEVTDAGGAELLDEEFLRPLTNTQSYTNVFPSLHLRYDVNEDVILRAYYGETIRRPNYNALSPESSVVVEQDGTATGGDSRIVEFERGNPGLDPLLSKNFEVSVDVYTQNYGSFGAAVFYKDLEDITVTNVLESTLEASALPANILDVSGGLLDGTFNVIDTTLTSSSSGEILGVELNYEKKFVELPEPFDGLGIDANITLVESEQIFPLFDGEDLVAEFNIPLEGQADYSGNVTASYEKGPWEARITYAFVDGFLNDFNPFIEDGGSLTAPVLSAETEEELSFERVGAKVQYEVNDRVKITWEGNNFNDEYKRTIFTDSAAIRENERNSWWMEFGVQAEF